MNNLRQIGSTYHIYADRFDDIMMPTATQTPKPSGGEQFVTWQYISQWLLDPSRNLYDSWHYIAYEIGNRGNHIFNCPAYRLTDDNGTYGINGRHDATGSWTDPAYVWYEAGITMVRRGRLRTPSKTMMATGAKYFRILSNKTEMFRSGIGFDFAKDRHDGRNHIVYVDEHVKSLRFIDVPLPSVDGNLPGHPVEGDFYGHRYQ